MTSYIIAGSSDRKEITTCENIARQIKSIYTDIEFNIILKHPSEWDAAIKMICKHYGLSSASNPIIFAKTGRPVGDVNDFIKLAQEKFGIDVSKLTEPINHSVNEQIAQDDYIERHRDKTLLEKIEEKYKNLLADNSLSKTKGFYQPQLDKGFEYFVKKTNSITPVIDVPLVVDYKPVQDKPFVDFEPNFCEGMTKSGEEGERGSVSVGGDTGRPESAIKKPTLEGSKLYEETKHSLEKVAENNTQEDDGPEVETQEKQQHDVNAEVSLSHHGEEAKSLVNSVLVGLPISTEQGDQPTDTPYNSVRLNSYLIENLGDNYYLSFHPWPVYDGQCIVFNNASDRFKESFYSPQTRKSQNDEQIVLFDYSLNGRKDNGKNYTEDPTQAKLKLRNEDTKSYLNKEDASIYEPFSALDWVKVHKAVKDTDSIAFFQLLPPGKKNYRPCSNGVVSLIPRQFLLKEHQNFGLLYKNLDQEEKLPIEKAIDKAAESFLGKGQSPNNNEEFITIGSLPFSHKIAALDNFSDGQQFKRVYLDMMQRLNANYENKLGDYGINVLLSAKWLMLVPLGKPYMVQRDTPIYLDAMTYLGYVVLPEVSDVWPQTGKLELTAKNWSPAQVLSNSNVL